MADYYDKLLGGIAVCLLVGVVVGLVAPIALHQGVLFGALTAMIFVLDALFGHPPLPENDPWRVTVSGLARRQDNPTGNRPER
jgi:hypothetical protein